MAAFENTKVGFIGGGMMATALIGGIREKNIFKHDNIYVSDPDVNGLNKLFERFMVTTTSDNAEVANACDIIFLSVKPQYFKEAAAALKDMNLESSSKLFVSIMAGQTLEVIQETIQAHVNSTHHDKLSYIRTMPNTPAMVGSGATAFCYKDMSAANAEKVGQVEAVFNSIGVAVKLGSEGLMDAVTGLSGSGPAYVYMLIESMADAGVKNGLPRDVALTLAAQTVKGSAQMVLNGEHPAVLKNKVESPGGTTIAGTAVLEQAGFRGSVISAVTAATERSAALGKK